VHGSRLPVDPPRHPVPDALGELIATVRRVDPAGELADYIPELARVDAHGFGIAATAVSGHSYAAGDSGRRFTIQLLSAEFGLHMLDRPRESVSAVESIRTDAATGTITIQVRGEIDFVAAGRSCTPPSRRWAMRARADTASRCGIRPVSWCHE